MSRPTFETFRFSIISSLLRCFSLKNMLQQSSAFLCGTWKRWMISLGCSWHFVTKSSCAAGSSCATALGPNAAGSSGSSQWLWPQLFVGYKLNQLGCTAKWDLEMDLGWWISSGLWGADLQMTGMDQIWGFNDWNREWNNHEQTLGLISDISSGYTAAGNLGQCGGDAVLVRPGLQFAVHRSTCLFVGHSICIWVNVSGNNPFQSDFSGESPW